MKVFVYDGSIEGFLNIVHRVYYTKIFPDIITKDYREKMFDEVFYIESDYEIATKVFNGLKNKFEPLFLKKVFNIFLCDSEAFEIYLLRYIVIGFKGNHNLHDIANGVVYYIEMLEKQLFKISHKYKGFIRFKELKTQELFALIEPKYNILPLISNHFVSRYKNQDFIIFDQKRSNALLYIHKELSIQKISSIEKFYFSEDEQMYQKLWKDFFKSIAIEDRKNSKLQNNFVPIWYRKYMTEFD